MKERKAGKGRELGRSSNGGEKAMLQFKSKQVSSALVRAFLIFLGHFAFNSIFQLWQSPLQKPPLLRIPTLRPLTL